VRSSDADTMPLLSESICNADTGAMCSLVLANCMQAAHAANSIRCTVVSQTNVAWSNEHHSTVTDDSSFQKRVVRHSARSVPASTEPITSESNSLGHIFQLKRPTEMHVRQRIPTGLMLVAISY
jgi:hypothetical protein